MTEPNDVDEITRALAEIFTDYYSAPTEMDLRGVDAATFALGLNYGFDSWQDVRVVANSRRNVATAARHWTDEHPSDDFLQRAAATDERGREHRRLLSRAHPGCPVCTERLAELRQQQPVSRLDQVDPDAIPDLIDAQWLDFQLVGATRSAGEEPGSASRLQILGPDGSLRFTAEHMGDGGWRITVRHPTARRATIRIRWTSGHETVHDAIFENDLADIGAEAPEDRARPQSVLPQITDAPEES